MPLYLKDFMKKIRFLMENEKSIILSKKDSVIIEKFCKNAIRNMIRDNVPNQNIIELLSFMYFFEEKYERQLYHGGKWYQKFYLYDAIVEFKCSLLYDDMQYAEMFMNLGVRKKVIEFKSKKVAP